MNWGYMDEHINFNNYAFIMYQKNQVHYSLNIIDCIGDKTFIELNIYISEPVLCAIWAKS